MHVMLPCLTVEQGVSPLMVRGTDMLVQVLETNPVDHRGRMHRRVPAVENHLQCFHSFLFILSISSTSSRMRHLSVPSSSSWSAMMIWSNSHCSLLWTTCRTRHTMCLRGITSNISWLICLRFLMVSMSKLSRRFWAPTYDLRRIMWLVMLKTEHSSPPPTRFQKGTL